MGRAREVLQGSWKQHGCGLRHTDCSVLVLQCLPEAELINDSKVMGKPLSMASGETSKDSVGYNRTSWDSVFIWKKSLKDVCLFLVQENRFFLKSRKIKLENKGLTSIISFSEEKK